MSINSRRGWRFEAFIKIELRIFQIYLATSAHPSAPDNPGFEARVTPTPLDKREKKREVLELCTQLDHDKGSFALDSREKLGPVFG